MDCNLHPAITVRLYTDRKCFGPGIAMLLRRVRELHSLREAEQGLGCKLLHSTTGGRGGGGAVVTAEGEALLAAYEAFEGALKAEGERLFREHLGPWMERTGAGGDGPCDL